MPRVLGQLDLPALTADVASPEDGQVWWRSDRAQLMGHAGPVGGGKNFSMSPNTQWPVIKAGYWYFQPVNGGNTTVVPTLNRMYALPFIVPRKVTLAQIAFEVTTLLASSFLRVGLYDSDTAGELPGALIADYGQVSTATVGVKTWTPGTPPTLYPGWLYHLACVAQGAVATFRARASSDPLVGDPAPTTAGAAVANAYYVAGVSAALPATFGTPVGNAQSPAAGLKFA